MTIWRSIFAKIANMMVVTAFLVFAFGCGEDPAVTEQRFARALIDSVETLPHVKLYAGKHLRNAHRAMASGDSLLNLDQGPLARVSYAEALVYARLSVVDAEFESLRNQMAPVSADSS